MEDREKPFIEALHMTSEDRSTQIKVGIFILIGLCTIAMMLVYFGRLGEGLSNYYSLRIEFANASGLLRGSEILLAGAKVGRIVDQPQILPDMRGVYVDVRILERVQIPVGSVFSIGSSGLLGDKFIQITLKNGSNEAKIEPGTTIRGSDTGDGIANMTSGAGDLINDLRTTVGNVNTAVTKINESVLSKEEMVKISETIKNLHTSSQKIAEASEKVDKLMKDAGSAIQTGQGTMDSAKKAADELQKTLSAVHTLTDQMRNGKGVMGTLISNKETADNLRALIQNLRQHGVLWYKDTQKPKSCDATTP